VAPPIVVRKNAIRLSTCSPHQAPHISRMIFTREEYGRAAPAHALRSDNNDVIHRLLHQ
jgi:hypothetical protein